MAMHKYFWWTSNVGELWFSFFKIKTTSALVGACFFLAASAFLYEFLKLLQVQIRKRQLLRTKKYILQSIENSENEGLLSNTIPSPPRREDIKIISKREKVEDFFIELCSFLSTFNLNYLLMLAVMIYNGWLFISVLIGGALGFFIFGHLLMKTNLENCQILRDTFCIKAFHQPVCQCHPSVSREIKTGESTPPLPSSREMPCHSRENVEEVVQVCVH